MQSQKAWFLPSKQVKEANNIYTNIRTRHSSKVQGWEDVAPLTWLIPLPTPRTAQISPLTSVGPNLLCLSGPPRSRCQDGVGQVRDLLQRQCEKMRSEQAEAGGGGRPQRGSEPGGGERAGRPAGRGHLKLQCRSEDARQGRGGILGQAVGQSSLSPK